ncbi:MAG TPA: zinc dependent phospholipase C family protein [Vicinamibacterales bacterium]|nr:zinc dependent phospholipase C family protein [Vicinamibacterales bacterium]
MNRRFAQLTTAAALMIGVLILGAPDASAYSVLAHEANIDALWDSGIRPLLVRRYPRTTRDELLTARGFAYGGSVIQDLGYYPFGSRFFSNLLHYVRSGDFVAAMIRDAHDVNEYAFALGTLAHYTADNTGHPEAVNRSVPLLFPKLRAKYGDRITYAESPSSHIITEFSFDIVQVAGGGYAPEAYHSFIGFQVAKPVLERAFKETYGLDVTAALPKEDLALSSYRHAISELIPAITRAAWKEKKDEIAKLTPAVKEDRFVYRYSRSEYEKEFGTDYQKPSLFARFLAIVYRLLPKIGPLRPLSFKAPTPEAERLFTESLKSTRARYAQALAEVTPRGAFALPNTDFDTGQPSGYGEYSLADDTYRELLSRLADQHFGDVSSALRANINRYYATLGAQPASSRKARKRIEKIKRQLAALDAH